MGMNRTKSKPWVGVQFLGLEFRWFQNFDSVGVGGFRFLGYDVLEEREDEEGRERRIGSNMEMGDAKQAQGFWVLGRRRQTRRREERREGFMG